MATEKFERASNTLNGKCHNAVLVLSVKRDMPCGAKASSEHRCLDIATLGYSQSSTRIRNAEFLAQHFQRTSNAAHRVNRNASPVLRLFGKWNPLHIARLISFVVVWPLYRVAIRAWSHVCRKRNEIVTPRREHRNSATAIIFVTRMVRIKASPFHVLPGLVFAGLCAALCSGLPVSCVGKNSEAPARFCSTALNVGMSSDEQGAAKAAVFSTDFVDGPNEFRTWNFASVVLSSGRHNNDSSVVVFSSGVQHQLSVAASYYGQGIPQVNG